MTSQTLLSNTELFKGLPLDYLEMIASVTGEVVFLSGEFIYRQGDVGHSLNVIAEGEVELLIEEHDSMAKIKTLGPGSHFGELSLLTGCPRSLNARAVGTVRLITLEKIIFDDILLEQPHIHRHIDEVLAERLKSASSEMVGIDARFKETRDTLASKNRELRVLKVLNTLALSNLPYKDVQKRVANLVYGEFGPDLCSIHAYGGREFVQIPSGKDARGCSAAYSSIAEGKTIINAAAAKPETIYVPDLENSYYDDKIDELFSRFRSVAAFPLVNGDAVLGVMVLRARTTDRFAEEELSALENIASHIAIVLKNARFYQESLRRQEELETLSRIGGEINTHYDLPRLLYSIVSLTASLMHVDKVILRLMDKNDSILKIKSYFGISREVADTVTQKIGEGIAGWVAREGKPIIANDVRSDSRFDQNIPEEVKSVLCVPLSMKGNVIGTMSVYDKEVDGESFDFDDNDLRLLSTVASQASIAIENARIFSDSTMKMGKVFNLADVGEFIGESKTTKELRTKISRYAATLGPVLLGGEEGTARRKAAKLIHINSPQKDGPYIEVDVRNLDSRLWGAELFGHEKDAFSFSRVRRIGTLEQFERGTLVLFHIEAMEQSVQLKLLEAIKKGRFSRVGGNEQILLNTRMIFISEGDPEELVKGGRFNKELFEILNEQLCIMPPLRDHRKDIPVLVQHYLKRFSEQNFKSVDKISPDAMGILMKYDWPGNLDELSNVIQRAVILTEHDEVLGEQILLGLPRTEGRTVYNILREPRIRAFFESESFPIKPRLAFAAIFFAGVLALFLGAENPRENIGMTIAWAFGWPLLFFSFFFLARIWCSVCALSLPGKLAQSVFHLKKKVPKVIVKNSGWIMAWLCIVVLWVEIVWNAYESALLTGSIIATITLGSLIFSVIYERDVWCRYICPLGAVNAVFSMASMLELRANRQLCTNRCKDHSCYKGVGKHAGCPMFQHPFSVDNNRDCTLCGNCIKNCAQHSIQLNARLAPQELWTTESSRVADSFLIVALAAICLMFAVHMEFVDKMRELAESNALGALSNPHLLGTLAFFGLIAIFWAIYSILAATLSRGNEKESDLRARLGYGLVPLVLSGFMAGYLEMFVVDAWTFIPNMLSLFGYRPDITAFRILSREGTATIQHIIIMMGIGTTLYSTYRIIAGPGRNYKPTAKRLWLPYGLILVLGITFLLIV